MGVSQKTILRLIDIRSRGYLGEGAAMLELGSQNLFCAGAEDILYERVCDFVGPSATIARSLVDPLADGGSMAELMRLCGIRYCAVDIFAAQDTILFDLNNDRVPEHLSKKFDLVTNFGTTEHVMDQYRAFAAIHDFTRPGGIMYHDVPMGGYFYHGYFSYTPLFFTHLALANSYEIIFTHFSKVPITDPFPHSTPAEMLEHGWPDVGFQYVAIEFIFVKTMDAPFRLPVDVGTSHGVDREFLKNRGKAATILRDRSV